MKGAPEFLSVDDVLLIHEEQLARYQGGSGIRDAGALESAVATPRATFDGELLHADLYEIAAAYAFHIAQNQPFVDGNKRTGLAAAPVLGSQRRRGRRSWRSSLRRDDQHRRARPRQEGSGRSVA